VNILALSFGCIIDEQHSEVKFSVKIVWKPIFKLISHPLYCPNHSLGNFTFLDFKKVSGGFQFSKHEGGGVHCLASIETENIVCRRHQEVWIAVIGV
jgi:hypothetical protein